MRGGRSKATATTERTVERRAKVKNTIHHRDTEALRNAGQKGKGNRRLRGAGGSDEGSQRLRIDLAIVGIREGFEDDGAELDDVAGTEGDDEVAGLG